MEDIFSIGEVSKLLDVPAATIRFWEQEGLLSPRKEANRYRAYGPRELAEIADVVFLRSTGVPVKRILQMRSFDLEQYQDGLNQLEDYMRSHLETCQRICGQIQRQMANTHEILRLQQEPYRSEEVPFEKIARFASMNGKSFCGTAEIPRFMFGISIPGICPGRKPGAS